MPARLAALLVACLVGAGCDSKQSPMPQAAPAPTQGAAPVEEPWPEDDRLPVEGTREFRVAVLSKVTITAGDGQASTMGLGPQYTYAWQRRGKTRILLLRETVLTTDGPMGFHSTMKLNRAGMTVTTRGKGTKEDKYDDMPENQKRHHRESFDIPLYKLLVDETGRVSKRAILAEPSARRLADSLIANVTLFHPPFPTDKDRWESDAAIYTQGEVGGRLTYSKVPGGQNGQKVTAFGTFTADQPKWAEGQKPELDFKKVKYLVAGEQTYDLDQKEWVTGKLDVDASAIAVFRGQDYGSMTGTITITFEMLPEKK